MIKLTSPNRAYLVLCLRHFAQTRLWRASDMLETLYAMPNKLDDRGRKNENT